MRCCILGYLIREGWIGLWAMMDGLNEVRVLSVEVVFSTMLVMLKPLGGFAARIHWELEAKMMAATMVRESVLYGASRAKIKTASPDNLNIQCRQSLERDAIW